MGGLATGGGAGGTARAFHEQTAERAAGRSNERFPVDEPVVPPVQADRGSAAAALRALAEEEAQEPPAAAFSGPAAARAKAEGTAPQQAGSTDIGAEAPGPASLGRQRGESLGAHGAQAAEGAVMGEVQGRLRMPGSGEEPAAA
jgi:hypothetical protein